MRVGNQAKPFEHFLLGVLIFVVVVNLLVVTLLWLGILKRPGIRHSSPVFPAPSSMNFLRNP